MKIQEIFTEYIELKEYLAEKKVIFAEITLYNNYIKPVYGKEEISTLNLIDYQNFANKLLSPNAENDTMSRDRIEQIFDILMAIYRYALKANYYHGDNLPQHIELDFTLNKKALETWKEDLQAIALTLDLTHALLDFSDDLNRFKERLKKVA